MKPEEMETKFFKYKGESKRRELKEYVYILIKLQSGKLQLPKVQKTRMPI